MNATLSPETTDIVRCAELTRGQREEMFALLDRYFEGVTTEQFARDLAEKNWVIHLRRAGKLVGFSTLLARETRFEGQSLLAIFSGDTIVAPEAWKTPALARAWIALVNRLRAEKPLRPCYWLLLTSGFRTYRFLPVFWRTFFPRAGCSTPAMHGRLMKQLAREQYGENYDEEKGLVRFERPQQLRGPLAEVPCGREMDANVAFFLGRNPGHVKGDELVCVTEISEANLTAAGRRMVAAPVS
jgi:hypothetical protein